jgi:hypothetical protein
MEANIVARLDEILRYLERDIEVADLRDCADSRKFLQRWGQ